MIRAISLTGAKAFTRDFRASRVDVAGQLSPWDKRSPMTTAAHTSQVSIRSMARAEARSLGDLVCMRVANISTRPVPQVILRLWSRTYLTSMHEPHGTSRQLIRRRRPSQPDRFQRPMYFRILEANLSVSDLEPRNIVWQERPLVGSNGRGAFMYSNNAENIYAFQIDRSSRSTSRCFRGSRTIPLRLFRRQPERACRSKRSVDAHREDQFQADSER